MSEIIFERKASTLAEIDTAFIKTTAAAILGVVVEYQLIKVNGIYLSSWNFVLFLLSIPAIFIFIFMIAESQKHAVRFLLENDELILEYEKADGDLIYLTDVRITYWWTYRSNAKSGTDLYMKVEGETGEAIVLRDALMLPWEVGPNDWNYAHVREDPELFTLETSNLVKLVNALPHSRKRGERKH